MAEYYENLTFVKRTKQLIKIYTGEFDATILVNCAIGLLFIAKEKYGDTLGLIKNPEIIRQWGIDIDKIECCKRYNSDTKKLENEPRTLRAICRHLRNSFAHCNFSPINENRIVVVKQIAIVPTAYPFFRAYELAEQLCDVAKKKSRSVEGTSWLDFAILHGEQAPTIEQIREQEYKGAMGDMHFGPYRVDGDTSYHYHIDKLLQAADGLEKLPRNKYKELRMVLQRGRHDMKRYMEQLRHDELKLPSVTGWEKYEEELWDNTSGKYQTPYVDAIEIIDYIPPKEAR